MNVGDADRVEELAEIAASFLAELGAQRGLVVHGDEDHAAHVTQAFFGLHYEELDALVFEFFELAEKSPILFEGERYGRFYLVAPLRDPAGDCLGMLYADSRQRFGEDAFDSMHNFAESYLATLLEICITRPVPPCARSRASFSKKAEPTSGPQPAADPASHAAGAAWA